jgi:hypothetical protein
MPKAIPDAALSGPVTGFYKPDKLHFSKSPFPWHYFQLKDAAMIKIA